MFVKKVSLPRRTFLRNVGITAALPFLDAMIPAFTPIAKAASPAQLRRAGFIYVANGTIPEAWTPASTEPGFAYSQILKPLEPYRNSAVVVTGLGNHVEGTHPTASSGWLTGVSAKPTEGDDVYNNTSIDQVIASKVGKETILPSLEIATEDFSSALGSCAGGYSCIYANTISWKSPTLPLPMEINPRVVLNACSAAPAPPRSARFAIATRTAFSIPSRRKSPDSKKDWAPAIAAGSTSTSPMSGKSKGASRKPKKKLVLQPPSRTLRSASPKPITNT